MPSLTLRPLVHDAHVLEVVAGQGAAQLTPGLGRRAQRLGQRLLQKHCRGVGGGGMWVWCD